MGIRTANIYAEEMFSTLEVFQTCYTISFWLYVGKGFFFLTTNCGQFRDKVFPFFFLLAHLSTFIPHAGQRGII